MPRFVVRRTFPDGLAIPINGDGARLCRSVIDNNAEEAVNWLTSCVSLDSAKTYCIYDGPSPEAFQRAAAANGLPVDAIAEVRVLDPYFYGATT